ncbi:MAG: hypothetical protein ABSD71_03600 [Bacteroidales bacterium]|jgi:hypothetical protein
MSKVKIIDCSEEENQKIASDLATQMLPLTNGKSYKQVKTAVNTLLRWIKDSIPISLEYPPE